MKLIQKLFALLLFVSGGLLFAQSPADRITSTSITLSDGEVYYDNRAAVKYGTDGTGIFMWNIGDKGLYFMEIGPDMMLIPGTKQYMTGQYFIDFAVPDGDHVTILLQKREGLERYDDAGWETYGQFYETYNTLQLVKLDRYGNEQFRTRVAGHQGVGEGAKFLCHMAGSGNLGFDGSTYTIYSEICGNFASEYSPDIHEGDLFVQLDSYGRVIPGTLDDWGASHSSLPRLTVPTRGEAYTATIGDSWPFGVQIRGYRNGSNVFTEVPYPDQDRLPYADMYAAAQSSTDAGEIGNVLKHNGNIITVMATVETANQPIMEQAKDLLFIKLDTYGNTRQIDWIDRTGRTDESMPYIMPYGRNILLLYHHKTEEYQINGDAVLAVIDEYGRYVEYPEETGYPVNWHSNFFTFPNGDIGWTYIEAYGSKVYIYRVALP